MLSEAEVFERFATVGLVRGDELYLNKENAVAFIRDCQKNELAVIGVEGFLYEDGKLFPQLDLIADYSATEAFSWESYKQTCNSDSEAFVNSIGLTDDVYLSLVVLSPEEYVTSVLEESVRVEINKESRQR